MNHESICPTCKTAIPAETTNGLCPGCLLGAAIEIGSQTEGLAETMQSDAAKNASASADVSVNAVAGKGDTEFGDYQLLSEIARGGMGVVYKARHRTLNRTVALKMILAGQLASDQDIQRFQREAEAAANLDHAGIVPIYEIGQHDGQHFFSMKFIDGGSLASRMSELRKDVRGVVWLIENVARAVHYAHQRGILHRDLKPANILLDENDQPLITDLGLARQIESGSDITRTGTVVGTPAYMPPEQAAAEKDVTTAVDIYAIGAILYEALTGRPPHVDESAMKTLMRVLKDEIAPPREVNRKVDRLLERICMKCLARDPNDRYSSAVVLADDLNNWLSGRSISVRRPSLMSTMTDLMTSNLRSAIGAMIIGIVAGSLVAFCISRVNSKSFIRDNPPAAIYEALPADIPAGRSLMFLKESKLGPHTGKIASLTWLATMVLVGGIVALIVRPKPGSEAVAIGLVAGLVMSITVYMQYLGMGIVDFAQVPQLPTVNRLAEAALGPMDQQAQARQALFEAYPGLEELPAGDRSRILTYRVLYDGFFQMPIGMIFGIAMSTLLSLFPCLVGTALASKLMGDPNRKWSCGLVYLEFMLIIQVLILTTFFTLLVPLAEGHQAGPQSIWGWGVTTSFYLFLVLIAVITYRRSIAWYWRLGMTLSFLLTLLLLASVL